MRVAQRVSAVGLAVAWLAVAACSKRADDGTDPSPAEPLPELVFRDETPNLLLTWIDARGVGHTETHPRDVPEASRPLVRVVLADRVEGTGDRVYVVDLTKPRTDGGYVARTLTRSAWEAEFQKRREVTVAQEGPRAAPSADGSTQRAPQGDRGAGPRAGSVTVIIYGASWCGPCHEAERWLKARGIPVVMKDIEATPGAEAEMQQKLVAAGRRGGSIPVIDVGGEILVGYSSGALERAVKKATGGTVL